LGWRNILRIRMFIAQLLIIQVIIFAGLIFFLRYILTRNITKATTHLQELGEDYTKKQGEAKKELENSKKESDKVLADARAEAGQYKQKLSQEAQQEKEKIIQETRQKSEQMLLQAEKTCESLKQEIEDKINIKAAEKAGELIQSALPEKFQKELHALWFKESIKSDFQLDKLHLPEDIREAEIISASPLTKEQKSELGKELKERLGKDIKLKEKVDPRLIAGVLITLGSVVIDGSLKYRIQQGNK
jgi:ATP synthase F1 delta subunit